MSRSEICAICREPITSSYNVRPAAAPDLSAGAEASTGVAGAREAGGFIGNRHVTATEVALVPSGYISSGSDSFKTQDGGCFKCAGPGKFSFQCTCGHFEKAVCVGCYDGWESCPSCRIADANSTFEPLSSDSSGESKNSSPCSEPKVPPTSSTEMPPLGTRISVGYPASTASNRRAKEIYRAKEREDVDSKFNIIKGDSCGAGAGADGAPEVEPVALGDLRSRQRRLVEHCIRSNSILELPPSSDEGIGRTRLAIEVIRGYLRNWERKAVIIAPTVPLVKQHLEFARRFEDFRTNSILGNATVDAWERDEWQAELVNCEVLLITPQLFLDALGARHLDLVAFGVIVVDECEHCIGSHPYACIFKEHYRSTLGQGNDIRVLGMSSQLVKRKVKGPEKQQALRRLEKSMHSTRVDLNEVMKSPRQRELEHGAPQRGQNASMVYCCCC